MGKIKFKNTSNWKETTVSVKDGPNIRPVVVSLKPEYLELKLKYSRRILKLPYSIAYDKACMLEADKNTPKKKSRTDIKRNILTL